MGKTLTISIWILKIVLGALFLLIGGVKLAGMVQTVDLFNAIGWGQWFRYFTGSLDIIGALLLFVPRWTWLGALLLVCTVGSAALFYIVKLHNDPTVPLTLCALAAILGLLARPRRTGH